MANNVVNIHEAKTHLSRLVDKVAVGAEVVIAKAGKPMARLVPIVATAKRKKLGLLKGKIKIGRDFNAPLDENTLALFEGRWRNHLNFPRRLVSKSRLPTFT